MKSIIATTNQGDHDVLSIYYGIDALTGLYKTGTSDQRNTLSQRILQHEVLTIIYDVRGVTYFVWSPDKNPMS